jgi:uncharacterized protein YegL
MNNQQQSQQQGPECPICFFPLSNGTAVIKTGCKHEFHLTCLQKTLKAADNGNLACPLCRGNVPELAAAAPPAPAPVPVPAVPSYGSLRANPDPYGMLSGMGMPPPMGMRGIPSNAPYFRGAPPGANRGPLSPVFVVPADDAVDAAAIKQAASASSEAAQLEVEIHLERSALGAGEVAELFGMLSIKAPAELKAPSAAAAAASSAATVAPPLDIVCVVDHSGSMSGTKMALLHKTLNFIVSQMKSTDRLGIVKFDSTSKAVVGMTRVTAENKDKLARAILSIAAEGGTDIASGLRSGLQMLKERRERNPVASVLLLTDGQDSGSLAHIASIMADAPPNTSVHTFGFGSDHDAAVMSQIAERARGTFTYIENLDAVGYAFAATLGGLSSICAVDLHARVSCVAPGVALVAAHSKYATTMADDKRSVSIVMSDLFAGESRDLVFSLTVPRAEAGSEMTLLHGAVSYSSPSGAMAKSDAAPCVLPRPEHAERVAFNVAVDAQRNRVNTTEVLDKACTLASANDLKAARELLDGAIARIKASASAKEALCVSLVADLEANKARLVDRSTFANGGYAQMRAQGAMHAQQRSVVSNAGPPMSSAYGFNAAQACMQTAYSALPSAFPHN